MTGETHSSRRAIPLIAVIVTVAVVITVAWYLNSANFHNYVRGRLVDTLAGMTGGKVEVGQVEWSMTRLALVAGNLTIHGLEGPAETPYVHVDKLDVSLKILSWWGRKIGLRSLVLEKPVIHVIVEPDGRTNQPQPRAASFAGVGNRRNQGLQPIFDLQADQVQLHNGILIVNDHRIPLDASLSDLQARLSYLGNQNRYDGSFSAGGVHLAYGDYKPFDSQIAAEFSLSHNQLEFRSAKIITGNSWVEASGRAVDFNHPQLTVTYRSRFDLAQVADITRLSQLRKGVLELNGIGVFSQQDHTASGSVKLQDLEYRDPAIRIPDLDGGADFKSENDTLTVPHLFAHALGGSITGDVVIRNWTAALKPGARAGLVSPAADAVARLRLTNLQVSKIAAAISTNQLPANKLKPVGLASGAMDVTFRGSPAHSHVRIEVAVLPVPASQEELPVTATIRGAYAIDTLALELAELNASARSMKLQASGAVARNNNLKIALSVGDLRDLDSLIAPLSPGYRLSDTITGRGAFHGNVSGTVAAPQIAGEIQLADFTVPIPLKHSWSRETKPGRVARFDSFSATAQYSPSVLALRNARLRRGKEDAAFDLTLGLENGHTRSSLPLSLQADIRNFEARDLQAFLGFDYPISGVTDAAFQIRGTPGSPEGSGHLKITNARLENEPYQSVSADLIFANEQAQLANLVIAHNGARITGSAAYNLGTTAFRFDVRGSNFNLAQMSSLQLPRFSIAGSMTFDAHGSGTTSSPVVNADIALRDFTLNRERMGNMDVKATTSAGVMSVNARSDFPAAEFLVDGTVAMHGDFPAQLALKFTRLDIDAVLHELLPGRITGHSSATGTLTLAGPLRQPRLLTIKGDLSQLAVNMENLPVHNDGPIRFRVVDQVLTLEEFKMAGEQNTQLTATGTVAFSGEKQLDLRAEGNIHMQAVQIFNPDLRAGGIVEFNINARGTIARPVLFGRAQINKGALSHITFPNGLSDINGDIVFNQDRMQIQTLTASTGGGTLTLGGFITYASVPTFNLTMQGHDIRMRYPQGLSTVVDTDLRLSGSASNSTLAGTVTVTRFGMTPQFDLAAAIAKARQAPEAPNPKSPLSNMRLSVHVVSTPELQVSTSLARLTGDMDLNVRGTAARPILLGRVNITEGQVTLNGTNFQLERGDITFGNPVRIEPVLDVEATTRARDYDITLGFHGPLDRMSTTYRSDPPLPTSDIIALLAFGRTREESVMATQANPSFTESASQAILSQALNSAGSTRMQRLFGVSRIKISPEVAPTEALDPNARVTFEQQVAKDFTVTYVTDLTHSGQQIIQIEYNYSRQFSILATRDQYGVLSFDVRIKRRRR